MSVSGMDTPGTLGAVQTARSFVSRPLPAYERGREFGAAHSREIGRTLSAYTGIFSGLAGGGPVDLAALGHPFLPGIEAWSPALAAELRGLADGAGTGVAELAALNARTEILARLGATGGECSTVVALRGDRPPVALQTWDWYAALAGGWLRWTIGTDAGPVTTLTEYGILGKIGVNARGVAVFMNILHHREDTGRSGVPVHLVARRVLDEAGTLDDALRIAAAARVSASATLTVATAAAGAAVVELWPGGPGVLTAAQTGGVLLHTNHFLTAPARDGDLEPDADRDTLDRYRRLDSVVGAAARTGGAADVIAAMAAHDGPGAPVCCHAAPGEAFATLATVVADLDRRDLLVWPGGPCAVAG